MLNYKIIQFLRFYIIKKLMDIKDFGQYKLQIFTLWLVVKYGCYILEK